MELLEKFIEKNAENSIKRIKLDKNRGKMS